MRTFLALSSFHHAYIQLAGSRTSNSILYKKAWEYISDNILKLNEVTTTVHVLGLDLF